mgnify:FL=1
MIATKKLEYTRDLPVRKSVDVFVAGGGPAGVAAAATAARAGASVFLAESLGAFGGMGTSAGIPFICRPTDGIHFLCGGIGREIYDRLFRDGGAGPEMKYDQFPPEIGGFIYNPEAMKRVYDAIVSDSGVDFTFHTSLIDLRKEGGRVTHAVCAAKSGLFAIEAAIFIDATGDGDLAAMAGAPFEFGDEENLAQAATLCSLWSGIDWSRKEIWKDGAALDQAFRDGVFSVPDPGLPGILHTVADSGWGNVGHVYGIDAGDERTVTRGMIQGRKLALEYERYYRNYVPGCENAHMLWTAQTLGIRESRRILGEYLLHVEDFVRQAVFDDEIGRYGYPIDLHGTRPPADGKTDSGTRLFDRYQYRNPGESYGIPYRVLLPKHLENVLTAGRCVSTDRYMHGSLRVQAGCFITGQAAGMAAALSAARQVTPRQLPVGDLQDALLGIGAYLPNRRKQKETLPCA